MLRMWTKGRSGAKVPYLQSQKGVGKRDKQALIEGLTAVSTVSCPPTVSKEMSCGAIAVGTLLCQIHNASHQTSSKSMVEMPTGDTDATRETVKVPVTPWMDHRYNLQSP